MWLKEKRCLPDIRALHVIISATKRNFLGHDLDYFRLLLCLKSIHLLGCPEAFLHIRYCRSQNRYWLLVGFQSLSLAWLQRTYSAASFSVVTDLANDGGVEGWVLMIFGLVEGSLSTSQFVSIAEFTEEWTESITKKTSFKYCLWIWLKVVSHIAQISITRTADISVSDSTSYETGMLNNTPWLCLTKFKPVQLPGSDNTFYRQTMLPATHL